MRSREERRRKGRERKKTKIRKKGKNMEEKFFLNHRENRKVWRYEKKRNHRENRKVRRCKKKKDWSRKERGEE